MPTDHNDPFALSPPRKGELGRLVTARHLAPGWRCRHCPRRLKATRRGDGLLCLNCDVPQGVTHDQT